MVLVTFLNLTMAASFLMVGHLMGQNLTKYVTGLNIQIQLYQDFHLLFIQGYQVIRTRIQAFQIQYHVLVIL